MARDDDVERLIAKLRMFGRSVAIDVNDAEFSLMIFARFLS